MIQEMNAEWELRGEKDLRKNGGERSQPCNWCGRFVRERNRWNCECDVMYVP